MNKPDVVGPTATWMRIVAILTTAADAPQPTGAVEPDLHSLALGAQILASRAVALLPLETDGDLEDVDLDVGGTTSVVDLIRAAGRASRRHPVESFPAGAAMVLAELGELVAEAEAAS